MKRIIVIFFLLFSNIFSLDIDGKYVIGEKGEKIILKEYSRIVVYNFGAAEILYKLGAGNKIVAIANHSKEIWPKEKTEKLPLAGNISKPSLEKILSYNPDLVIFNVMGNEKIGLDKFNIPSITFSNKNLNDILKNTLILGKLTNKESESIKVVEELNNKLNYIKGNLKLEGKALVLYSDTPPTSFEKKSLPVEILETLGLEVIVPEMGKKPIVSSEYILKENPDYIIGTRSIKNIDGIVNGIPLIEETKAYKTKNIHVIDSSEILRASHRVFDEIEKVYFQLKK
ncbi:ABC transporter substrate-binding protein [Cetobacterium somerae]|uniref:ABC transporter substrate-binding protein n=1 Tax=Cetobacterium sp. NK01 TaxID=2993530 RepID=UPI002115F237|nr:ABC transporter substrate-binding protein [Cetobacterium sp. NK01]MCQ8211959.1 ABC transporter substrate-binding protein [Cetobacterium sp. NK01]